MEEPATKVRFRELTFNRDLTVTVGISGAIHRRRSRPHGGYRRRLGDRRTCNIIRRFRGSDFDTSAAAQDWEGAAFIVH